MKHNIIIVRLWEGLGNQMFQYAYARMLTQLGNVVYLDFDKSYENTLISKLKNTPRENGLNQFNIQLKGIDVHQYRHYKFIEQENMMQKFIFFLAIHGIWFYKFYEEKEAIYNFRNVRIKGNYYIKGWFQSEKYFYKYRNILLKEFTPRNKIRISSQLKNILNTRETVSIHVRRGDYIKYRKFIGMSYYKKALKIIEKKVDNPIYIIFTDDYKWVKQNFINDREIYYIDENERLLDYEQLLVMSKCKSNIIANSTFSWWAAWLNQNPDKLVIAPTKWFRGQEDLLKCKWIYVSE